VLSSSGAGGAKGANWGPKTGLFFAGTGTIVVVIAWFILPEVAQRTTSEIDEMFEKKVNPRKFKSYVTEVQRNLEDSERRRGERV
jgi:SP family general alpha glucoside:H+ symporter-like MFS transporter